MKKFSVNEQDAIQLQKKYLEAKQKNEKPIYDFAYWCVQFCKARDLEDERVEISTRRHIYTEAERLIKSLCDEEKMNITI